MDAYKILPKADEDLNIIWLFGLERFGETQADKYYYAYLSSVKTTPFGIIYCH